MLKIYFTLYLVFCSYAINAQGIDNDTAHHFLILYANKGHHTTHIIKESEFVQIYDKHGKYHHGKLYFINDSVIRIVHPHTITSDTMRISDIQKAKIKSILYFLKGYTGILVGSISALLGINLLIYEKHIVQQEQINGLIGAGMIIGAAGLIKKSASLMGGKWISSENYRFITCSSQQKSLKRKQLKPLLLKQQQNHQLNYVN